MTANTTPEPMVVLRKKVRAIEAKMNSCLIERQDENAMLMLAVITPPYGQHVMFQGDPGLGKSHLLRCLTGPGGAFRDTRYFEWQCSPTTEPMELFGPRNLKLMLADPPRYAYLTDGMLPDCHFAFLDELPRANTAVLNAVLALLNERTFSNGSGNPVRVPLQSAVVGCNHWPGSGNEDVDPSQLEALNDRFLFRSSVKRIAGYDGRERLVLAEDEDLLPTFTPAEQLTVEELALIRQDIRRVKLTPEWFAEFHALETKLTESGVSYSDRRCRQAGKVVKAQAWLDGKTTADALSMEPLKYILWNVPEHQSKCATLVLAASNPFAGKVAQLDKDMEVLANEILGTDLTVEAIRDRCNKFTDMGNVLGKLGGVDSGTLAKLLTVNGKSMITEAEKAVVAATMKGQPTRNRVRYNNVINRWARFNAQCQARFNKISLGLRA